MTDLDRAFAEHVALRRRHLPTHWVEPELIEQGDQPGAAEGLISFDALTTQARESAGTTWIVYGTAGLGKSTLLRALEVNLLGARAPAIYLNAPMLRTHEVTKDTGVGDLVRESRPRGFPEKFWKACVKRREVVILLDGANEIRREFPTGAVRRLVGKLLGGNHGFTVVASSRDPDEDGGELRLVRRLKLQEFSRAQAYQYVAANGLDARASIEWLDAIGLTGASSNPLLLRGLVTLMKQPKMRTDVRPASRAQLLSAAALAHVERGRVPPDVTREIEAGAVVGAAWAACATRAHFARSGEFTRQEALELLEASPLGVEAGGVLDLFLEAGPVDRAPETPAWDPASFTLSHRRYTDLGLAIGWGSTTPPAITHNSHFFGGFVADWCALQEDPTDTVRAMASRVAAGTHFDTLCDILVADTPLLDVTTKAELWDALGRGFTMARSHRTRLADAVGSLPGPLVREGLTAGLLRRLAAQRPDMVGQVRDALLTGTLDGRRLQRIYRQAARSRSVARARQELDEGLTGQSDESAPPEPREVAKGDAATLPANLGLVIALEQDAEIGEEPDGESAETALPTDELIQLLLVSDKAVRVSAASQLSMRLGEAVVTDLGERLIGLPEPECGYLAGALGRIGSPAFISSLAVLLDSPVSGLRRKALTALGRIGGTTALQLIRSRIDDADPAVRGTVATALGFCGDMTDLRTLIALVEDPDPTAHYPAIGAIGRYLNFRRSGECRSLHSQAELDEAVACLEASSSVTLARVCKMLRTMAAPRRAELLERWTEHTAPTVRGSALTALESIDGSRALQRARFMLSDSDEINRAAAVTVIGRTGTGDDAPQLRSFLRDPVAELRGAACQALARLGDVGAMDTIVTLATDDNFIVRGSACTAIGTLGAVESLPLLIRCLNDPVANVRGSAAKALGLLGATEAVPQLCRSLMDDVARVRGTAAVALGMLGDAIAVPPLVPLAKDPEADVRRGVVFALGQIGEVTGLPAIIEAGDDPEPAVRWNAATALGHVGDSSAVEVLVRLLHDTESHVRGAATTALGQIGHSSAVEPIMETACDANEIVRGSVATALGRIGDPRALDVLLSLSSDWKAPVRSAAISALGRAGFSTAITTIEGALVDKAPEVRGAAVRALSRLEPGRDLTPYLADTEASVRRAALAAVGESSGTDETVLLRALHDEDAETRSVAVMALANRPSEVAIAGIVEALDDSRPDVSQAAVESLGHVVGQQDLRTVIHALTSAHKSVRLAAAELLGTHGDRAAEPALLQMLHHSDPRSRVAAAQALGHIGSPQSTTALIDALRDPNNYVRGTAATALARVGIGSDAARAALLEQLADSNEAVVGLAARSLGVLGGEGVADRLKNYAKNVENGLWTRTTAVQAAALLYRRPQPWMRELADEHRGSASTSGEAKFRGAIIDAVTRGAWDNDVATWTRTVLLADPDPINQTAAATALGNYRQLSPQVARDFLADPDPTPNRRRRSDSAGGGRRSGAATGAVLQGAIKSAAQDAANLATVGDIVAEALNRSTSAVVAGSTLSALRSLEPVEAMAFVRGLREQLAEDTQQRFRAILQSQDDDAQHRIDQARAYEQLADEPRQFLNAFASNQPRGGGGARKDGCDIGVVTIIGEEARAVQEWLQGYNPSARQRGPGYRYTYQASVPAGDSSPKVVATQALDQGQTSATNAFHYLVQHFHPRFMVLLGVAGGIHSDVSVGDVVIGTQVIDYGPAASTPGGVRHRGSAFRAPAHIAAALNDFFSTGGEPRDVTAHKDSALLDKPFFTLQRGPIGTGPRVVKFREAEERQFLTSYNEKTLALETEAESIARHFYEQGEDGHLTGYIVLRGISDHADEEKNDRWKLAASRNAVLALAEILPTVMETMEDSEG